MMLSKTSELNTEKSARSVIMTFGITGGERVNFILFYFSLISYFILFI